MARGCSIHLHRLEEFNLLDLALRMGRQKLVKLFLENGLVPTDASICPPAKYSLLDFCRLHDDELFEICKRALNRHLRTALMEQQVEDVKLMLDLGAQVNEKLRFGEVGEDVDDVSGEEYPPLFWAVK